MSNKRYKLLKDIQSPMGCVKAGTVSIFDDGYYVFPYEGKQKGAEWLGNAFMVGGTQMWIAPEWFEEIKPERIEVNVGGVSWVEKGPEKLLIETSPLCAISEDKFPAIKQAIESVLNDDPAWKWQSEYKLGTPFSIGINVHYEQKSKIMETVAKLKNEAVKSQKFQEASEWREVEKYLKSTQP